MANAATRNAIRQLDSTYSTGDLKGGKIAAMSLPATELASVVRGKASIRNVPWINPINYGKISTDLANYRENRFDRDVPEEREKLKILMQKSISDHRTYGNELARYREFEIENEVLVLPFALGAFQAINLSADELPLIRQPAARKRFTIRSLGQDGGARLDYWSSGQSFEHFRMTQISTDKVTYPIMDIQAGNISEFDRINAALTFDLQMQIDTTAMEAIDNAKTTSGLRALLDLHPDIVAANIPDTNYLDLTNVSYGAANTLTLLRIKAILDHMNRFGVGVTPDGAATIQSIVISPQNVRDQWDFVDLVSGWDSVSDGALPIDPQATVPSSTREQIFQTGVMNNAWGNRWVTTPNARLAKGRLYVFTNQPLGWYFTKNELDKTIRWEGPDEIEMNFAQIMMTKVLNFVIPDLWKKNILIVDF